jgi:hypothetical protein
MAYLWGMTTPVIQKFLGASDSALKIVASPSAPNEILQSGSGYSAESLFNFVAVRQISYLSEGYTINQTPNVPTVGTASEVVFQYAAREAAGQLGFIKEVIEFGKDSVGLWIDRYFEDVEHEITRILRNHIDLSPLVKLSLSREKRYHLSRDRYTVVPFRGA